MLKSKIALSKRSEFTRNIVKLISGTAIAQLVSVLISPILTRLFTREDFGLFTLVTSISGLLALVAGGRYELAILLPKKKGEAANVFVLTLIINCVFSVFLFIILWLLDVLLIKQTLGIWYYLIPVFVFLIGLTQSINAWFNKRKMYREIAVNRITISGMTNGFSLINGLMKFNWNGLLGGALVANFINLLVVFVQVKKDIQFIKRTFSKQRMKSLAKQYIRFPLINSFQAILDASQINGLIYLITGFFGKQVVGVFSIAIRILFMPMNLIGSAISQVFYQEASDRYNTSKEIIPLMKKTTKQNILLMSSVLIIILLLGPFLFSFVYGDDWRDAGVYAQLLCPWICLDFIRSPLSQIPLILGKQKEMLYFSIVSNVMILIIVFISGFIFNDLLIILSILSGFQIIYLSVLIAWIFKITVKYDLSLHH